MLNVFSHYYHDDNHYYHNDDYYQSHDYYDCDDYDHNGRCPGMWM